MLYNTLPAATESDCCQLSVANDNIVCTTSAKPQHKSPPPPTAVGCHVPQVEAVKLTSNKGLHLAATPHRHTVSVLSISRV